MISAETFESQLDGATAAPPPEPVEADAIAAAEPEVSPDRPTESDEAPSPSPESEAGRTLAAAKRTKEGRKQSIQREIDDLVRQRADTQRERDRIAAEVADLERKKAALAAPAPSKAAAPAADPDAEPQEDQFETYGQYVKAQARWEARQEIKQARENYSKEAAARDKAEQARVQRTRHDDRVEAFKATRPDFDDLMASADALGLQPSEPMIQAILESEIGPQMMVHLAEHPDEYRRITSLPRPLMAYREMSKLEARLEAASTGPAPVVSVSQAKPPLKPVGSAPSTGEKTDATDDMDVEEFIRVGNAAERKRHSR